MSPITALAVLAVIRRCTDLRGEIVTSVRLVSSQRNARLRIARELASLGVYAPVPVGPVPCWRGARDGTRGTWETTWGAS